MNSKFHRPAATAEDFIRGANEPVKPLIPATDDVVAPWDAARADVAVYTNFKMTQVTHAKMVWITDNVPKLKSMQKIIDAAVLPMIEKLIAEHFKP